MSKELAPGTWSNILKTMRYAVVIEKKDNGYSAYAPDLPGCIAAGDSRAETERLIREAIAMHVQSLKEQGHPIPGPSTSTASIQV